MDIQKRILKKFISVRSDTPVTLTKQSVTNLPVSNVLLTSKVLYLKLEFKPNYTKLKLDPKGRFMSRTFDMDCTVTSNEPVHG